MSITLYTHVASHALLQQEDPKYNAKRDELFDYYHPIEYDPKIPTDEKTKLMEEWYVDHFLMFIQFILLSIFSTSI